MIELLKQDRKREYLNLCTQNYAEAVSIAQELFPEHYEKAGTGMDPFDSLYDKALETKKRGNTEEEIRILETAVQNGSAMPYCYERLAILYSKQKNYKRAYEVCVKWFDAVFWKLPNASTSSLRLLDRLEKLREKVITNMRISLENAHVEGIPEYIKNLRANSKSDNFKDFLLEGTAAIMFAKAGCSVAIRKPTEPPDLALRFSNELFYAEVKHFRLKKQDQYGDTVPPACEQIFDVAKKKIDQYAEHAPNILVIENNDARIEDLDIPTAIDRINEYVRSGKCPRLARLNGILLISLDWYNISQKRQVYFRPTSKPAVSLRRELFFLLDDIRLG